MDPLPVEPIERFKEAMATMRAMVLAAGLGTRLRPITYAMPKPMVPVLNRPVMEHILRLLARHGFTETIANLHWFPELIEGHFGDGTGFGVELTYSPEEQLLGTSGGVRNAAGFLGDSFLVISGDALTDIDLAAMREFHESHDGIATLATKRVEDTSQFGVAITGSDGRIQGFQEKPDPAEALSDLANCGIYMFRSRDLRLLPRARARARRPGPATHPASPTGRWTSSRACWRATCPSTRTRSTPTGTTSATSRSCAQGTLDGLDGTVEVEREGELVDGFRSGAPDGDEGASRARCCSAPAARSATTSASTGPR